MTKITEKTINPRTLGIALRRAWLATRQHWFGAKRKTKATGEEVRTFVRNWLDQQPNPSLNIIRFWLPLSDEEKAEALLHAFPDKEYLSGTEEEAEYVIDLLSEYENRFNEILNLIGDKQSFKREEKEHIQHLLKHLKEDLDEDCKEENRRQDEMTECERRFFYPAVRKTHANIRVRWNTDPIKSRWHSELYGARMDISHPLFQLKNREPKDSD